MFCRNIVLFSLSLLVVCVVGEGCFVDIACTCHIMPDAVLHVPSLDDVHYLFILYNRIYRNNIYICIHTRTSRFASTRAPIRTYTHTLSLSLSLAYNSSHTHTYTHTHNRLALHTRTHTHMFTQASYTHTHTLSFSLSLSLSFSPPVPRAEPSQLPIGVCGQ